MKKLMITLIAAIAAFSAFCEPRTLDELKAGLCSTNTAARAAFLKSQQFLVMHTLLIVKHILMMRKAAFHGVQLL